MESLWSEEGLQQPQRSKKRKRLYHHDCSIIRLRPTRPNHAWSVDIVHDKLSNGGPYKMLTVLDEYTCQALAVEICTRMTADDVLEVLYGFFLRHGKPDHLRSDIGPEFTSESSRTWLQRVGVESVRIYPGSSWENGYNERFNGTLHREMLRSQVSTAPSCQVDCGLVVSCSWSMNDPSVIQTLTAKRTEILGQIKAYEAQTALARMPKRRTWLRYSGRSRMQDPSFSQSLAFFGSFGGTVNREDKLDSGIGQVV